MLASTTEYAEQDPRTVAGEQKRNDDPNCGQSYFPQLPQGVMRLSGQGSNRPRDAG
jgi:hypothetical protein